MTHSILIFFFSDLSSFIMPKPPDIFRLALSEKRFDRDSSMIVDNGPFAFCFSVSAFPR